MKKLKDHWKFLVSICLIGICFLGYIYKDSSFQAHDLSFHLANIENLVKNPFRIHLIMPRLAHDLGYGLYIFYPFLPHLTYALGAKALSSFSFSLVQSVLVMNVFVSVMSSIILYFLSFRLFRCKKVALLSALIYLLFPYRLGTITVRMALNENFCSLFIPLILLSFTYLFGENISKGKFLSFFVLGYVGLIFSHLIIVFYFTFFVFFILLFYFDKFRNKKILFTFLKGVGIVCVLVLPNIAIFLEHYGMNYLAYQENYITSYGLIQENILGLKDLLIPPAHYDWTIPFYLSFPVIVLFVYSSYLAIKRSDSFLILLTVFSFLLLFLVVFEPFWKILPSVFYNIQFPWRLLLIASIFLSLLAPTCLKRVSSIWFIGALSLVLLFSVPLVYKLSTRIYHYDYSTVDVDAGLGNLKEYYPAEYLKYSEYYESKTGIDILFGKASVSIMENDLFHHRLVFSVTNSSNATLEFPKIYYKGYQLIDESGKKLTLDRNEHGFVCANLSDGIYTLTYHGTFLFRILSFFRISFILICGGYCILFRFFYKK